MAINVSDVSEFYLRVERVCQSYGLTISEGIVVLSIENHARRRRSALKVLDRKNLGAEITKSANKGELD